jgi:hypothetical protein
VRGICATVRAPRLDSGDDGWTVARRGWCLSGGGALVIDVV